MRQSVSIEIEIVIMEVVIGFFQSICSIASSKAKTGCLTAVRVCLRV